MKSAAIVAWLLRRLGAGYHSESLAGDLLEQYAQGRSGWWLWRETFVAVATARTRHAARIFNATRRRAVVRALLALLGAAALGAGTLSWAGALRNSSATPAAARVATQTPQPPGGAPTPATADASAP